MSFRNDQRQIYRRQMNRAFQSRRYGRIRMRLGNLWTRFQTRNW